MYCIHIVYVYLILTLHTNLTYTTHTFLYTGDVPPLSRRQRRQSIRYKRQALCTYDCQPSYFDPRGDTEPERFHL